MTPRESSVDGRALRWEAHKRERREAIIDAAIAVVEEHPPGADIHVNLIAEKVGLGRPAIYRHFADRADLDQAIQHRALGMVSGELLGSDALDGSIHDALERGLTRYVVWASAHPALHRHAIREASRTRSGTTPAGEGLKAITDLFRSIVEQGAIAVGAEVDDNDLKMLDLFVFGIVSQSVSVVRMWLSRPVREPEPEVLAGRLTVWIWGQLRAQAEERGGFLDPALPVSELLPET